MMRKPFLTLILALVTAVPLAAQSSRQSQNGRMSAEAQVFLNAFQVIRDYGLTPMTDSLVWNKAIEGLIRELDDPYASVFTPEQYDDFQEENTGDYAGIGVQITQLNERITVTAVFRSTPAERAGMQVGDVILAVDKKPTMGWTTAETSDVIRGPVGTSVGLSIGREGLTAPLAMSITRDNVHVSAVVADRVEKDIGYISLDRVARTSAAEIDSALTVLSGSTGLILDLRGNPGGFMDESLMISDLFLDPGARISSISARTPGQRSQSIQEEYEAEEPARAKDVPMVILVDRFSASAAEIISGALQDNDRALVLGERTFGKGVFQNVFRLTETRHLRLTTGEWYTPLGRSLHRPRRVDGRPHPEDPDTFKTVETATGRTLVSGGGIFPDLTILNDTLTLRERAFISQSAGAEVPLALRIEEFAFAEAERLRRRGEDPRVADEAFEAFVTELAEAGVERDFLEDAEIRAYLEWRANIRLATRMERTDVELEWRRKRDPVLEEAVRLLQAAESQASLFEVAAARKTQLSERAEEAVLR